jgi:hypothetical protein
MVSLGADDWNTGLYWACEGNSKELVKFVISQGADNWELGVKSSIPSVLIALKLS